MSQECSALFSLRDPSPMLEARNTFFSPSDAKKKATCALDSTSSMSELTIPQNRVDRSQLTSTGRLGYVPFRHRTVAP